jgi:hypothetical protein
MIGDDKEIKRAGEFYAKAVRGGDFLTTSEAECILLSDPVHGAGIDRNGGMQVRISPQNPGWKIPTGVGRKFGFSDFGNIVFGKRFMVAGLLRPGGGS